LSKYPFFLGFLLLSLLYLSGSLGPVGPFGGFFGGFLGGIAAVLNLGFFLVSTVVPGRGPS
jgi:hypothetical protein